MSDRLPSGYEWVRCDLCGLDNTKVILEANDLYNNLPGVFTVVQCQNCGYVYTNPRPYGKELSKYYPDEAGYFKPIFVKEKKDKFSKMKKNISDKVFAAFLEYYHLANTDRLGVFFLFPLYLCMKRQWEIEGIPRFRQNGNLLDIGSSYGIYLKQMKDLGWKVMGVEPNRKAADFGSKEWELTIINNTFENANINDKFDVIVMRMALEHLQSPSKAFKKVYTLLKEGGIFIIIVPDFSGIEFRLFKKYWYPLQVPAHLNHFTPSTITDFCEKYGFKVEKIVHHSNDRDFVASAHYMKEDGLNKGLAPVLSNKLFRRTILRATVLLLSYFGMTSRMTVYVRRDKDKMLF